MQPDPLSLFTLTNANKSYGGNPVLVDASINLKISQVHALVGENGAGKSTLIRIISGVTSPDSASFFLRGNPVEINSPADAHRLGVRVIHQELQFVRELSVAENIFLGHSYPSLAGIFVDWKRLYERAREVLLAIGIRHIDPRVQMAKLSTGDKMMVRIAGAFIGDEGVFGERGGTSIYVMDEPTASLTGAEVEQLFTVIRHLRSQGYGILYVSHRLDEIMEIADHVTVMRNGHIVASESIETITHDQIIESMIGREINAIYPPRRAAPHTTHLLAVTGLSTETLHDVSFDLHHGEVLGVVGLRDNGQTDLLEALVGLQVWNETSRVTIDDQPIPQTLSACWDAGIAYVPKERRSQGLVMGRSVRNNVTLPYLDQLGVLNTFVSTARERNLSQKMGREVRLQARGVDQRVRQLSGGNQQKVLFARALAEKPRLLLLDEPTRGVDVGAKVDIYNLIRAISEQGTGIIVASSDIPEIIGLCDRIIVMVNGKVSTIVDNDKLTEAELLNLSYGDKLQDINPHE